MVFRERFDFLQKLLGDLPQDLGGALQWWARILHNNQVFSDCDELDERRSV